jgi:hypothetical protein
VNYVVEMGSSAMIFVPTFIKTGSGIHKMVRGEAHRHTDLISLFTFFQNKEIRLKMKCMSRVGLENLNPVLVSFVA